MLTFSGRRKIQKCKKGWGIRESGCYGEAEVSGVPLTPQTTVIMADRLEIRHSYCTDPGMADEPTRKEGVRAVCVCVRERAEREGRESAERGQREIGRAHV